MSVGVGASVQDVADAIDAGGTFVSSNASGATFDSTDFTTKTDPLSGGLGTGLAADLVVRIGGDKGSEVFNFRAGATITQIVNAINLVSDGTGVQATDNAGTLDMFERPATIADDRGQARTILGRYNHAYGLSHAARIACRRRLVNPTIGSMH